MAWTHLPRTIAILITNRVEALHILSQLWDTAFLPPLPNFPLGYLAWEAVTLTSTAEWSSQSCLSASTWSTGWSTSASLGRSQRILCICSKWRTFILNHQMWLHFCDALYLPGHLSNNLFEIVNKEINLQKCGTKGHLEGSCKYDILYWRLDIRGGGDKGFQKL